MARCKTCTLSAHAGELPNFLHSTKLTTVGCYGIASQDISPDWECELCTNVKQEDYHLVSFTVE